jgi:hypothetical protein
LASSSNYEYRKLLLFYLSKFKKLQSQNEELMEEINDKEKLKLARKSEDFLDWFSGRMNDKYEKLRQKDELAAREF